MTDDHLTRDDDLQECLAGYCDEPGEYRAHVQAHPLTGTHVITIKGHRPAAPPRAVTADGDTIAAARARREVQR